MQKSDKIKLALAPYLILKSTKGYKGKFVDVFIEVLVLLNVAAVILESYEGIEIAYGFYFDAFELFTVSVFLIEYLLRLWLSDINFPKSLRWQVYKKHILSANSIIDLVAILPFFIPFISDIDLRHLRIFRLIRLMRVFKLTKYSQSLILIGKIISEKKQELLATFLLFFSVLVIASSLMFYIEHDVQPSVFPNILQSFWWGIITLTTIGYGDMIPMTAAGKVLGGLIAMMGVLIIAIPTAIISSSFVQKMEESKDKKRMAEIRNRLREAFYKKYIPEIACKVRRGSLSLEAVKVNLELAENDIYKIAEGKNEFRFRILKNAVNGNITEKLYLEYREIDTEYGTFTERKSKLNLVSPESLNKQGIGYFVYCVSEKLRSNYISNEFYGDEADANEEDFGDKGLELENAFNFRHNKAYFQKIDDPIPDGFLLWKEHLQKLKQKNSIYLVFNTFEGNDSKFIHLTYFKKINPVDKSEEYTISNLEKVTNFKNSLEEKVFNKYQVKYDVTENGNFMSIRENNILTYISDELRCETLLININQGFLAKKRLFGLVGIISDTIKEELIGIESNKLNS
ncbi:MAG: ion transporter [Cytophagales bacterium]|nr:MAG: ion transporter [Cytophagales bacterium]